MTSLRIVALLAAGTAAVLASPAAGVPSRTRACAPSAVHYAAVPRGVLGVRGVPWIASTNAAFHGYLFYFGATRWGRAESPEARIFTTRARVNAHPKVLWVALRRSGASLAIRGTRLDGAGSFDARYPAAIGGRQFPSYVKVPGAGCWRVTLRSGDAYGAVTFLASDRA